MLSEIVSFLVFAVSLVGILGFFMAILTSPPLYIPKETEEPNRNKKAA